MKYSIACLVGFLFHFISSGQNILYDSARIKVLVHAQKDSISSIIKKIDRKQWAQVGYINQYSSFIDFDMSFNHTGLNYLYLLEVILTTRCKKIYTDDTIAINTSATLRYQYYPFCVLVKGIKKPSSNINSADTKLKFSDLIRIKHYLTQWWDKNKHSCFREIEDMWAGEKPLNRLGYSWR